MERVRQWGQTGWDALWPAIRGRGRGGCEVDVMVVDDAEDGGFVAL